MAQSNAVARARVAQADGAHLERGFGAARRQQAVRQRDIALRVGRRRLDCLAEQIDRRVELALPLLRQGARPEAAGRTLDQFVRAGQVSDSRVRHGNDRAVDRAGSAARRGRRSCPPPRRASSSVFGSTFGMSRRFGRRVHGERHHGVDADASAQLGRQRLGESSNCGFRGGVRPHARGGVLAGGRADVDDRAAVGKTRYGGAAHVKAAAEVHVEHPPPGGCIALDLLPRETASDVGDDVGAAERGLGRLEGARGGGGVSQVDAADVRPSGARRARARGRSWRSVAPTASKACATAVPSVPMPPVISTRCAMA